MHKIKYLHQGLSSGFKALYSGRAIQFVANGLLGLFLPIFFLEKLGGRIELVFLYYLLGHLAYGLFVPLGAKYLNRIGINNSLRISVVFWCLYYVSLFFIDINLYFFLGLSIILLVILRMLLRR